MKLSARNQLHGTVVGINKGEAIAKVELDVAGCARYMGLRSHGGRAEGVGDARGFVGRARGR